MLLHYACGGGSREILVNSAPFSETGLITSLSCQDIPNDPLQERPSRSDSGGHGTLMEEGPACRPGWGASPGNTASGISELWAQTRGLLMIE